MNEIDVFVLRLCGHNKHVLDIGCNIGAVTLQIAKNWLPKRIIGVDIDSQLIGIARKNIRHYVDEVARQVADPSSFQIFPASFPKVYGPLAATPLPQDQLRLINFPRNVVFKTANYVLETDDALRIAHEQYDVIMMLSITKWIHLNWGDAGLKRTFRRAFNELNDGGCLILEPQPFASYKKRRKLTPEIMKNFDEIKFRPDEFKNFLLKEIGFATYSLCGLPEHKSKGFRRPIYVFWKKNKDPMKEEAGTSSLEH